MSLEKRIEELEKENAELKLKLKELGPLGTIGYHDVEEFYKDDVMYIGGPLDGKIHSDGGTPKTYSIMTEIIETEDGKISRGKVANYKFNGTNYIFDKTVELK